MNKLSENKRFGFTVLTAQNTGNTHFSYMYINIYMDVYK